MRRIPRRVTDTLVRAAIVSLALSAFADSSSAQTAGRAVDTVFLDVLQHAAESTDKRAAQIEMLNAQSTLRLQTIRNEDLPVLSSSATAQYLSDVASIGSVLGTSDLLAALRIPAPYHEQYDVSVTAKEPIFDATRSRRVAVENAQTAESAARIRAALWQQRQQVNDAFFAIQLYTVQQKSIDASIVDLTSRRTAAQQRVDAGTALPSEALILDAEIAHRRQSLTELVAQRDATRAVLTELAGTNIPEGATLVVRGDSISVPPSPDVNAVRSRPEYAQFDRSRDLIAARSLELSARDLPRVSAFGRVGYGRPGLNPLGRAFDAYWNAGLQLDWSPFNYGRSKREIESQQLQAQIVGSDEAAFTENIRRSAIAQRGQISALAQSLPLDDSIVALRERVLRESRLRFDEGDLTSAEYIARSTEHLAAQLERDARRVRLTEARARYFTTIGREVR